MKKTSENLMRFGAWIGGSFAFLLMGCAMAFVLGALLLEGASAASSLKTVWSLLPRGLRMTGFTLSTAIAAVTLSFPFAWALATVIAMLMRPRETSWMRKAISSLSAIPAVVFGYLSLCYVVPLMRSAWWGVTVTLMLMSLMRHTLELIQIHERHYPAVEAAQAMGAFPHEAILQVVLPRARRSYLGVVLRMMARCMGEGVAILLVLSAYGGAEDTLSTALMKAMGVTGSVESARWVLLLVVLLLALVMLTNAVISYCLEGGRHGEKKDAQ